MSDINVTVQDEIVNIDVLDTPVLVNVVNSPGQQGPAGPGVPVGGTAGQILAKASATDYDTAWINNYAKYLATNVRNQTGSTIAAFQVVYISGATGNKPLISLADADTEATSSKTYGVTATSIANNGTGDVVTAGELSGINTSAFNEGDLLWLSTTAGGVVTTPPAEPAHAVFIGYVVRSHPTLGVIDVSIQNGYELNELHGVQITTPTDNQGLFYNSTSTLWENKSITTALGYTPVPTTRNITINGVTYDLSADRTYTISTGISGSGASGQVTYWTGASAVSGSNNLFWDNTNSRLGIGTNVPLQPLHIVSGDCIIITRNTSTSGYAGMNMFDDTNTLSGSFAIGGTATGTLAGNMILGARKTSGNLLFVRGAAATISGGLFSTGNFGFGFTTDPGVRVGVLGDTLLRGSGNTSATTALTVQDSGSTNTFRVRNDGGLVIGNSSLAQIFPTTDGTTINTGAQTISIVGGTGGYPSIFLGRATAVTNTFAGTQELVRIIGNFTPTSGSHNFEQLRLQSTINQTGGANGITRGLYVNPTLTSAADFRAIETTAGNVLFGSNFFWDNANGRLGIGTNTPTQRLDVSGSVYVLGENNTTAFVVRPNALVSSAYNTFEVQTTAGAVQFAINRNGPVVSAGQITIAGQNIYRAGDILFRTSAPADNGIIGQTSQETGSATLGFTSSLSRKFTFSHGVYALGNTILGTATADAGQRLQVYGDTLLRGSGATSATTALTVQDSSSQNMFRVFNNGTTRFGLDANNFEISGTQIINNSGLDIRTDRVQLRSNAGLVYFSNQGDSGSSGVVILAGRNGSSTSFSPIIFGSGLSQSVTRETMRVDNQNQSVLIGTSTNVASSIFTMESTTKGFLPPRMTTTQKNAIATPAAGLVVYDTTLNKLCVYTTAWETITSI